MLVEVGAVIALHGMRDGEIDSEVRDGARHHGQHNEPHRGGEDVGLEGPRAVASRRARRYDRCIQLLQRSRLGSRYCLSQWGSCLEKFRAILISGAQDQSRALELVEQAVFHEDDVAAQRQHLVDDDIHDVVDVVQEGRASRGCTWYPSSTSNVEPTPESTDLTTASMPTATLRACVAATRSRSTLSPALAMTLFTMGHTILPRSRVDVVEWSPSAVPMITSEKAVNDANMAWFLLCADHDHPERVLRVVMSEVVVDSLEQRSQLRIVQIGLGWTSRRHHRKPRVLDINQGVPKMPRIAGWCVRSERARSNAC